MPINENALLSAGLASIAIANQTGKKIPPIVNFGLLLMSGISLANSLSEMPTQPMGCIGCTGMGCANKTDCPCKAQPPTF